MAVAPLVLLVTTGIRHYHPVMNQIARMVVSAVSRSPRILKWGAAAWLLCLPTLPACALLANL
ncbi:MAG: hypothetical protein ABIW57_14580, partial [Polyangia bacterium]